MSWKDIVSSVAPVLGTALGGPLGGMAVKAISGALLGEDEPATGKALEKKIAQALNTDPEALLKLKQANNDFDVKMKGLDIDVYRLDVQDRSDARSLAKDTTLKPQIILSTIYVLGFMSVLYTVFSGSLELTGDQKDIAMYLLGILSAGLLQIMNFFFGSSSGSKEKTSLIGDKQK